MPRTGTGRIYQRGVAKDDPPDPNKVWWIDYGFRGKRYRESTDSTKRKDAVDLLRKRMAEMGSGAVVGPTEEQLTFADLRRFHEANLKVNGKRTTWARCEWDRLEGTFAGFRAVDITTDRIEGYIVSRQESDAANSTIQKELSTLRRAFNLARRAGRLTNPPYVPGIKSGQRP